MTAGQEGQPGTRMVSRRKWEGFRDAGMLWLINSILHLFGWAIVCEIKAGIIFDAYPARVRFRGFDDKSNAEGYRQVSIIRKASERDAFLHYKSQTERRIVCRQN